jgi:hypothetical protein
MNIYDDSEWDKISRVTSEWEEYNPTKTTNFLLEIMEDKIKFDLLNSLKEPSKHDKQEYMNLFKIQLNSLLKTKLIEREQKFKQCNNCQDCFNKNYFKCYHICDSCNRFKKDNIYTECEDCLYESDYYSD